MLLLLIVSFVWAFSFGLIKGRLTGLDPTAVAVIRIAFATVVFLPLLQIRALPRRLTLKYALIGAVQFGGMYIFYLHAFAYLQAYQIALFTIFTPLYVALLDAALTRRFQPRHMVAALLSVVGAALVMQNAGLGSGLSTGFLLVQCSNLCFAAGQLAYKRARAQAGSGTSDARLFGLLYLGALVATLSFSLVVTDWSSFRPTWDQWGVLAYLGVLASGVCFFWWNLGATRVNTGTLAAFNNAKVPLGVACSLLFFGESADLPRLTASLVLLALAVWVAER